MRMAGITRVLGRMREIEALIYPEQAREKQEAEVRFEEVLEEKLDDPYDGEGGFSSFDSALVPESVAERLAMWEPDLQELSGRYGVDPHLARAVMRMESGGNPNAVSGAGALGLMQLMPGTARGLGVDPADPKRNLEGGIKYLAQLADKYDGDYVKTLAAYNAGPARVDSYDGVPPFPETERYVKNVLALYRKYSRGD
ncbi:MAG: lytic transglycosylase domain-containing protein [Synergistaceae bacterium]|jgi:soluble lytic murein transglycosylase-like protein|nr:lytic transglycosylase domain-containing protein [Synergistaceae bacterium]